MEWKSYEEWLDITLYRQMTNLIYKLSSIASLLNNAVPLQR